MISVINFFTIHVQTVVVTACNGLYRTWYVQESKGTSNSDILSTIIAFLNLWWWL